MPLTAKGEEIKSALTKEYGEKAGERVLYAGKNKGTFSGIDCDKLDRLADGVNRLAARFDAMVDIRGDADSAAKIDDALLGLRMAIKSLTSATTNEVSNETRLLKNALNECLRLDISRSNNRFAKRSELIMQANALMARRISK